MKITKREGGSSALTAAVKVLDGSQGRVGWFESAKTPDGTPVAGIASVQEFGSPAKRIPPRSFMRSTSSDQAPAWAKFTEQAARAVVQGKLAPDAMTEALALKAEGDVRRTISKIVAPPLSPLTLLARKERKAGRKVTGKTLGELTKRSDKGPPDVTGVSTKPLVDSGLMLATLTSQVTKK